MRIKKTAAILTSLAAATMLAATACGSSGSTAQGGDGIASQIRIQAVNDQTGAVAYAGTGASRGAELAIAEINEQGFLGDGITVSMEQSDPAGQIDRAVSETTTAMANPDISAILGPTMGQQAAAVAPIVNQRKTPTIFTQSGAEGVVTGDYTFRATAPMGSYYDIAMKWLADNDLKNVSVIYNATFPTFADLGKDVVPAEAKQLGIDLGQSIEAQSTTQDFTGQAQQIASANPQAVIMLLTAPQSVTFLKQLRQAGYQGQVVATSVQSAGNVSAAGDAANGLVYPVDFSSAMDSAEAQKFVAAFEEKYGKQPDAYAAEGYDAIWWLARGIKSANSSSREGIQQGLTTVASKGFTGAMGDITFDGNDMRVPGAMILWENGKETLLQ
ncbi:ABC transporter substrate-binding protein [Gordonia rhizosphera]|uniref:Putative ABC transporter substrate-binding protein n=1 Tax=Gordonia rhizosphera NBRC 16068 TaxID=1108045 RepID=K6UXZ8_9ACTN|nr:ABC transporter substrate-binding protein [Gordonia rhizosphera]GAB88273.1 putative ABC transporter substrate-binding protein [Gordonia rhizosphera NBRC 16068]